MMNVKAIQLFFLFSCQITIPKTLFSPFSQKPIQKLGQRACAELLVMVYQIKKWDNSLAIWNWDTTKNPKAFLFTHAFSHESEIFLTLSRKTTKQKGHTAHPVKVNLKHTDSSKLRAVTTTQSS